MNTNNSQTFNSSGVKNNSNAKLIMGIIGASIIGGAVLLNSSGSSNVQPTVSQDDETTTSCQYSCTGPDLDCSDFSTHQEAQDFFDCCGFTADNDPMKLDSLGVGDGVACESI